MLNACFRSDAIASVADRAVLIDEAHRRDVEIGLPRKTGGTGFRSLYKCERGRMRTEMNLDRRRFRRVRWVGGRNRSQQLEKLLAGARRETVGGVGDDVGVG